MKPTVRECLLMSFVNSQLTKPNSLEKYLSVPFGITSTVVVSCESCQKYSSSGFGFVSWEFTKEHHGINAVNECHLESSVKLMLISKGLPKLLRDGFAKDKLLHFQFEMKTSATATVLWASYNRLVATLQTQQDPQQSRLSTDRFNISD